ncbi:hypothetical protein O5O45_00775 [Hahella aquimaris]|uniref:hypothetical protein n=1 Tax=Hahella sp. HNIBRBA332 TaxID=3015983 RepID=UPI00273C02D0|nr:hypothetical protein [Hahella sp. HNIBRBA332]WLQ14469.1 hypothetical protein O5O45_00775 [Hahella sp. HNIBRBA332]
MSFDSIVVDKTGVLKSYYSNLSLLSPFDISRIDFIQSAPYLEITGTLGVPPNAYNKKYGAACSETTITLCLWGIGQANRTMWLNSRQ